MRAVPELEWLCYKLWDKGIAKTAGMMVLSRDIELMTRTRILNGLGVPGGTHVLGMC